MKSGKRVESPYDGPVQESRIEVAGKSIVLVRPSDPDRLMDDPEVVAWNVEDDYMPYWAYLWPGAFLLSGAIMEGDWPRGTKALEIGCGLGLPGLVAVSEGLHVHFTDRDLTPLRFLERSARANGFDPVNYSTGLLDWKVPPDEQYPLIFGADVTYERRLIPLVVGVIDAMLEPGGLALITDPDRVAAQGFVEALRERGLDAEATPAEARAEDGPIRGTIYRIRRAPISPIERY
ncbi:class I SAM-dependent methyltransferase [Tundrisphaera lichenicola]|uniref:class I SAM-dependent methyltransferase n=1 Tax=Tundrisphaera lichenicola TaxID=2029860 RepID=UPI003EBE3C06